MKDCAVCGSSQANMNCPVCWDDVRAERDPDEAYESQKYEEQLEAERAQERKEGGEE
jgi:hypothetical protein